MEWLKVKATKPCYYHDGQYSVKVPPSATKADLKKIFKVPNTAWWNNIVMKGELMAVGQSDDAKAKETTDQEKEATKKGGTDEQK